MKHPVTVFDRPQWNLIPDPAGLRHYGNVSNRLEVVHGSSSYRVALAVPTELMTFLREIAGAKPEDTVSLSLDSMDDFYVFSVFIEAAEKDTLFDLWPYHYKALPVWLTDRQYRL